MPSNKQPATKAFHVLNTPYSDTLWPIISPKLETAILDLLLPLLLPVGQYRDRQVKSSKGKGRTGSKRKTGDCRDSEPTEVLQEPAFQNHLTVGFNSTVRCLESLSQRHKPHEHLQDAAETETAQSPYAVLVCTSVLPDVMTSPIPLLAATASLSLPSASAIRVMPVSQSGSAKIAEAMKQPRVNVIGLLRGFVAAQELQDFVTEQVVAIDVPWLRESADNRYRPTKIESTDVEVVDPSLAKLKKRKRIGE